MYTETAVNTMAEIAGPTLNRAHSPGRREALKAVICNETVRMYVEQRGGTLRAIVLTGSLARDEATFVQAGEYWEVLGDAEFMLILEEACSLPSAADLALHSRRIEESLLQSQVQCHVTLDAVHPTYLRKLRPHIFAYELRTCGQVVWGEERILSLIPRFSAPDIPLEDAWRLLCNRMIELIDGADELAEGRETLPQGMCYRTVKLYLDMATSFLIFAEAYAPTYGERAKKLRLLADGALPECGSPFPLPEFSERVMRCTGLKLAGPDEGGVSAITEKSGDRMAFWEEAVAHAEQLWRWELARLTGTSDRASNGELYEVWMGLQPLHHKLRGWLSLLRRRGWHRSWREWWHWGRRFWRASPRYWVYAVASELFFRLPGLVRPAGQRTACDVDWEELRSRLPLKSPQHGQGLPSWQRLASDIMWNYRRYLGGTRA